MKNTSVKKHTFLFLCTVLHHRCYKGGAAAGYLGLEPLGELHCYVHVGETEGHVVEAVIVHSPTDLVSDKTGKVKKVRK